MTSSLFHRAASRARPSIIVAGILLLALSPSTEACSLCGCSVSTDWNALGFSGEPGSTATVRFDYIDQDQLRRGRHVATHDQLHELAPAEIEQRTLTRTTWFDFEHALSARWSVLATLPFHDRFHSTKTGEHHHHGDEESEPDEEAGEHEDHPDIHDYMLATSHTRAIGDARITARWLNAAHRHRFGAQLGLKLPTGRFDQSFASGPVAGHALDRGLQPGTGTTDLLAGVSWFDRPATAWGCFAQATWEQPLAAREGFLPSSVVNVSAGIRWLNSSRFTPQLQINTRWESREHGRAADRENSGGTLAYASPGITAELTPRAHAYVFVQLPVWQDVHGFQLEPRFIFSTGVTLRL